MGEGWRIKERWATGGGGGGGAGAGRGSGALLQEERRPPKYRDAEMCTNTNRHEEKQECGQECGQETLEGPP